MSETHHNKFDVTALPMNMRAKIMVGYELPTYGGTACWEWTGAKNSKGYGSMTNGKGGSVLTHRRSYELLVGAIPVGLQIDHLCRNKVCLNTDHLEPVTQRENVRRAAAVVSHCPKGHEYAGENLRWSVRKNGHQHKVCVTCHRASVRASAAKRKAIPA